jgi:hypothetical protein
MDVGEPEVAALVGKREPQVIDSHEVQDRGVEVVDVDLLVRRGDVVGVVVGGAPGEARPDANVNSASVVPAGSCTRSTDRRLRSVPSRELPLPMPP